MLRWLVLAGLLATGAATPLAAQQWARTLFETTSHNFGSVARGAKAEFSFVLTNKLAGDLHVAAVRSSCGCTTPRIEKPWLKSYEQGAIVAHLNSSTHVGQRAATVTVTIDQPAYAEVQLHIAAYVHDDVLVWPPSVELGSVDRGTVVENKVMVYRGNLSGWKITAARCDNPLLSAKVSEIARQGSQTWYELRVRLAGTALPGYVSERVMLSTNDPRGPQLPVMVEGQVLPVVAASPASLFLGVLRSGEKVTKPVVVRSKKLCCITGIAGDPASFEFPPLGKEPKTLHGVPVTFVSGAEWGKVVRKIRIQTDLPGGTADIVTYAVVEGTPQQ
jgi:hypothetical protein